MGERNTTLARLGRRRATNGLGSLHAVLSICLCFGSSGCSFAFTDTLPDDPDKLPYFDCTSTPGLAVADGVIALSNGAGAFTTLRQSKSEYEEENDGASRNLVAGVSIGLAALSAASGIYGIIQSERCRRAKGRLRDRLLAPERQQHKLLPAASVAPAAPPSDPLAPSSITAPPVSAPPPSAAPPSAAPTAPAAPTVSPPAGGAASPPPVSSEEPPLLDYRPQPPPGGAPEARP